MKPEVRSVQKATRWGLTNPRGQPLSSQAIGMRLRNRLYIGLIDVPDFGVRDQRGDFEPLIAEDIFYKAQAVLSGQVPLIAPLMRNRPDFPLRGFVRCAACDLPTVSARPSSQKDSHRRRRRANSTPEPDLDAREGWWTRTSPVGTG